MIIGLTGGIASGKSTVGRLFKKKGAVVFDADTIAHKVIARGSPAYEKVVSFFGPQILNRDRSINRHSLSKIVFSSASNLKRLNSFVHPRVIKIIENEISKRRDKKVIVIDAPLLIEAGLHKKVDRVVVVKCRIKTQVERLLKRDGFSPQEAMMRIRGQLPLKYKLKLADEIVDGEITLKKLKIRVNQIWEKFVTA